jgi:hypothetical protein
MRAWAVLAMLVVVASAPLPAQGAAGQGYAFHVTPQGVTVGAAASVDGLVILCQGDAPLQNSCHIDCRDGCDFVLLGPVVGGSFLGTPVSAVEMSALVTAWSGNKVVVQFGCDYGPAATAVPPAPTLVRCVLLDFGDPSEGLTAFDFHAGVFDPGYMFGVNTGLNSVEAGVGHWAIYGAA